MCNTYTGYMHTMWASLFIFSIKHCCNKQFVGCNYASNGIGPISINYPCTHTAAYMTFYLSHHTIHTVPQ